MTTPSDVTDPRAVLAAIQECDRLGRPAFLTKYKRGRSTKYAVLYEGETYDPKAILAAAHAHQHRTEIKGFTGGEQTNNRLRLLGFRVVDIATGQEPLTELADLADASGEEGSERLVEHYQRERDAGLVRRKKNEVRSRTRRLACEVCGFDFKSTYGSIGEGFAECHHTVPLSAGVRRTTLSDLVLLCSNCHRMVHRRNPWLTIEELRGYVRPTSRSRTRRSGPRSR